ncbi:MAG: serine/threonine-protein kinase [Myxococcota bacterium]
MNLRKEVMVTDGCRHGGRLVGQRYELVRWLAGGAHASIWVARHTRLHMDVAIKFLHEAFVVRRAARLQFAREARTAASIRSRHVVRIFDFGVDHEGSPYIVMELLHGEDLASRLARACQLDLSIVARVLTHACSGLGRAHAAGVVHRDVKPHNIFLSETADEGPFLAKLLDFGVAAREVHDLEQTPSGHLVGTPLYMSPEQAAGHTVDHRSDLYSLATSAYHALAGRPPFTSKSVPHLMAKIITEPPPAIGRFCPSLPPAVQSWFQKALRKRPSDRFGTAREMADTFGAAALTAGSHEWSSPEIDLYALLEAQHQHQRAPIDSSPDRIMRAEQPSPDGEETNAEATLSVSELELDAVMSVRQRARCLPISSPRSAPPASRTRSSSTWVVAAVVVLLLAVLAGILLGSRTTVSGGAPRPSVSG